MNSTRQKRRQAADRQTDRCLFMSNQGEKNRRGAPPPGGFAPACLEEGADRKGRGPLPGDILTLPLFYPRAGKREVQK